MHRLIIASLLISLAFGELCKLETLYKDETRPAIVKSSLSSYFNAKFLEIVEDTKPHKRYLIPPANHFKKDIKKLFIEYGRRFQSVEDLEIILKGFNYTRIPLFKAFKEDVEKFGTDLVID